MKMMGFRVLQNEIEKTISPKMKQNNYTELSGLFFLKFSIEMTTPDPKPDFFWDLLHAAVINFTPTRPQTPRSHRKCGTVCLDDACYAFQRVSGEFELVAER